MSRLVLFLILLVPCLLFAQTDAFEKIEIPVQKNDFENFLTFWKEFNSLKTSDFTKWDSIEFYKDDTLTYTYYIDNLRSFERSMHFADSVIRASTDSIYNKQQNSYDVYFSDPEKK